MTKQSKTAKPIDQEAEVSAQAPTTATATGGATKQQRAKPSHPPYIDMIKQAIKSLNERKGSSRQAIFKYITANFSLDSKTVSLYGNLAIRKALDTGVLIIGKSGGVFKMVEKKLEKKKQTKSKTVKKSKVLETNGDLNENATTKKAVPKSRQVSKKSAKIASNAVNTTAVKLARKIKTKALNISIKKAVAATKKAKNIEVDVDDQKKINKPKTANKGKKVTISKDTKDDEPAQNKAKSTKSVTKAKKTVEEPKKSIKQKENETDSKKPASTKPKTTKETKKQTSKTKNESTETEIKSKKAATTTTITTTKIKTVKKGKEPAAKSNANSEPIIVDQDEENKELNDSNTKNNRDDELADMEAVTAATPQETNDESVKNESDNKEPKAKKATNSKKKTK